MEDFRSRIEKKLVDLKWKKPQLAEKADVNYSTIKTWYNRLDSRPNLEDMLKIAKALGTSVEYLMTDEEPGNIATDDPAKTEIYQFIINLDQKTTQQILGVLKLFNYMTLNPQFMEKREVAPEKSSQEALPKK